MYVPDRESSDINKCLRSKRGYLHTRRSICLVKRVHSTGQSSRLGDRRRNRWPQTRGAASQLAGVVYSTNQYMVVEWCGFFEQPMRPRFDHFQNGL